jgi:predicted ribosomally synthesized peptide with SipW-like signal peptide
VKRLLLSVLAIFLVIGLVGAGTFAWFQDTETSTGNTFTAGTLDLKVADGNEGFGDGVSATWNMSNMAPGVAFVGPFSVGLQNSGSVAANHVEISFSHNITDTPGVESDTNPNSAPADLARWIQIISMSYNGVTWVSPGVTHNLTDLNGNGFLDLEDVTLGANAAEGGPLDNLPPPLPNSVGFRAFAMTLRFNAGATNDIQGDILTTTVIFTLNQHSSQ